MQELTNYTIAKESIEDQIRNRRFHPALEITFTDDNGKHRHEIASGYADEISVFQEDGMTLVLSYNPKLAYVGLELFQGDKKINEVFLVGSEMLAAFGKDDLEPARMIEILKEWL